MTRHLRVDMRVTCGRMSQIPHTCGCGRHAGDMRIGLAWARGWWGCAKAHRPHHTQTTVSSARDPFARRQHLSHGEAAATHRRAIYREPDRLSLVEGRYPCLIAHHCCHSRVSGKRRVAKASKVLMPVRDAQPDGHTHELFVTAPTDARKQPDAVSHAASSAFQRLLAQSAALFRADQAMAARVAPCRSMTISSHLTRCRRSCSTEQSCLAVVVAGDDLPNRSAVA
jgi:hypothetical protein